MFNQVPISIVGDNEIFCEGLSRILYKDFCVTPHFFPIKQIDCLKCLLNDESHLVLVESQSGAAAIAAAKSVRMGLSNARLILMVDEHSPALAAEALASGVEGVVLKGAPYRQLKGVLNRFIFGVGEVSNAAEPISVDSDHATQTDDRQARRDFAALTRRERQIVGHLITGDSNKVIARNLDIAEATVKAHLKIVLRKLRVDGRTKAALYALQHGLTTLSVDSVREL